MKRNYGSYTGLQEFKFLGLSQAGYDIILKHETHKACLSVFLFLIYFFFFFKNLYVSADESCQSFIFRNRNLPLCIKVLPYSSWE